MIWKEKVRKLSDYKDLPLLFRVFFVSLKISLSPSEALIRLANPQPCRRHKEREKIVKYVCLCLYFRKLLGLKDTCLTSSLLLCNVLRQYGIEAQVNFSAKKDKKNMAGHCWVSIGDEEISSDYSLIFKYP